MSFFNTFFVVVFLVVQSVQHRIIFHATRVQGKDTRWRVGRRTVRFPHYLVHVRCIQRFTGKHKYPKRRAPPSFGAH